jgi:RNA polymerase sigma factor (sigma-70 family)
LFKKYSDITIIEGVRQQDGKILNWLYDNYFQQVKRHVLNNRGSSDDVSDIFQDSIIALYNQITDGSLSLNSDLKGYFFGIARNLWSIQLRRIQRTGEQEIDISEITDHFNMESLEDPTLERLVSQAFSKLKPDQQMVLSLYSDGNSYEDIAGKMGLKNETYARRKKYLSKEAILELLKEDPEYHEYLRLL